MSFDLSGVEFGSFTPVFQPVYDAYGDLVEFRVTQAAVDALHQECQAGLGENVSPLDSSFGSSMRSPSEGSTPPLVTATPQLVLEEAELEPSPQPAQPGPAAPAQQGTKRSAPIRDDTPETRESVPKRAEHNEANSPRAEIAPHLLNPEYKKALFEICMGAIGQRGFDGPEAAKLEKIFTAINQLRAVNVALQTENQALKRASSQSRIAK